MGIEEENREAWDAKVTVALLIALADGRYELSERDALTPYVSPHNPRYELPLSNVEKGRLVIEAALESWGFVPRGGETALEKDEGLAEYDAYRDVLERIRGTDRPVELLRACREALGEPADREEAVALAYDVARADGRVDPEEQTLFQTVVKVLGASEEEVSRAKKTANSLAAWEARLEAAEKRALEEAGLREAPRLTPLEGMAGIVPLALHADLDVEPVELDVVVEHCDEWGISLHEFQDAIRMAEEVREVVGPLGLLDECRRALGDAEEREQALALARAILEADDTLGPHEREVYEVFEDVLG